MAINMLEAKVNLTKLNGKPVKMTHCVRCRGFAASLEADVFRSI